MDADVLRVVGQIAGLAGISLGVFLLLFRKIDLPKGTRKQLTLFMWLVWSIALAGILCFTASKIIHRGASTRTVWTLYDDIVVECGLLDERIGQNIHLLEQESDVLRSARAAEVGHYALIPLKTDRLMDLLVRLRRTGGADPEVLASLSKLEMGLSQVNALIERYHNADLGPLGTAEYTELRRRANSSLLQGLQEYVRTPLRNVLERVSATKQRNGRPTTAST